MKKLLFATALIFLMGHLHSANAGNWVPFAPVYTTSGTPYVQFTGLSRINFLGNGSTVTVGNCSINFKMTGGTKYKAYFRLISYYNAGMTLNIPQSTTANDGSPNTGLTIEWGQEDCSLTAGGVFVPSNIIGYVTYEITFYRYEE
jgi:hypothetical protein